MSKDEALRMALERLDVQRTGAKAYLRRVEILGE